MSQSITQCHTVKEPKSVTYCHTVTKCHTVSQSVTQHARHSEPLANPALRSNTAPPQVSQSTTSRNLSSSATRRAPPPPPTKSLPTTLCLLSLFLASSLSLALDHAVRGARDAVVFPGARFFDVFVALRPLSLLPKAAVRPGPPHHTERERQRERENAPKTFPVTDAF